MSETPYIGFSNASLRGLPKVEAGDTFICPRCGARHELKAGQDADGNPSKLLMFYNCRWELYLGAVNGRLVVSQRPDVSGGVNLGQTPLDPEDDPLPEERWVCEECGHLNSFGSTCQECGHLKEG